MDEFRQMGVQVDGWKYANRSTGGWREVGKWEYSRLDGSMKMGVQADGGK